jgi:hypothetical protein
VNHIQIRRAIVLSVLITLLAAACANTHQWIYEKPGMSPESLDRDRAACRTEAPPRGLTKMLNADDVDRGDFTTCMQRRGYTARREVL